MPPEIGALALLISNLLHLRTLNCMLQTHRPRTSCRRSNVDLHFTNPPSNTKPPPPKLNYNPPLKKRNPFAGCLFWLLLVLCCLFCSRKRETAATTTAPAVQRERERETAATTTAPAVQSARNCNYYDRFTVQREKKLQLLRPFQLCRERERETAATIVLRRPKPPSIVNPPCPGPAINRRGGGVYY